MTNATASLIQFASQGAPPSFAPSAEQQRFMWLHERHFIVRHQWVMRGSNLRAFTENGLTATISKGALTELVEQGLMRAGIGYSYELTKTCKEQVS